LQQGVDALFSVAAQRLVGRDPLEQGCVAGGEVERHQPEAPPKSNVACAHEHAVAEVLGPTEGGRLRVILEKARRASPMRGIADALGIGGEQERGLGLGDDRCEPWVRERKLGARAGPGAEPIASRRGGGDVLSTVGEGDLPHEVHLACALVESAGDA
jgi:hypothetical protein